MRWREETSAESGRRWLHLDWKESGVEMPSLDTKPKGGGQGRELIERVLPYQFDVLQIGFGVGRASIMRSMSSCENYFVLPAFL